MFFVFLFVLLFLIFFLQGSVPYDNIEQWKRNLAMLLRDKDKQELISRDKKDRRDFDDIAFLASKMGLYRYVFSFKFMLL